MDAGADDAGEDQVDVGGVDADAADAESCDCESRENATASCTGDGECIYQCDPDTVLCGELCVPPSDEPTSCGCSQMDCTMGVGDRATGACSDSEGGYTCVLECEQGWSDTNGEPGDGCECPTGDVDLTDGLLPLNCEPFVESIVFVSQGASGDGLTPSTPIGSLADAVELVDETRATILVRDGTLTENISVDANVIGAVAIYGGRSDNWSAPGNGEVTELVAADGAVATASFFNFSGVNGSISNFVMRQDLSPQGSPAITLEIHDSTDFELSAVTVYGGTGGGGADGTTPANGASGGGGTDGVPAKAGVNSTGYFGSPGGTSTCGSDGGRGGNSAAPSDCVLFGAATPDAQNGFAGQLNSNEATGGGLAGDNDCISLGNGTSAGGNGDPGAAGNANLAVAGAVPAAPGSFGNGWTPSVGATGAKGVNGAGGGGGGGGGTRERSNNYDLGGSGAGGGAGGCGAEGGSGGTAGGDSIAILLVTSDVNLDAVDIFAGEGGAGGDGAAGACGGRGGSGGNGLYTDGMGRAGGSGGNGGAGQGGGGGAGGNGGWAIGVGNVGGQVLGGPRNFNSGTPGNAGNGGNSGTVVTVDGNCVAEPKYVGQAGNPGQSVEIHNF